MNSENKTELKVKVVFAFVMGIITTGIISFSLIAINIGFIETFVKVWLKSWLLAYAFVIPAILFIAPPIERFINYLFQKNA